MPVKIKNGKLDTPESNETKVMQPMATISHQHVKDKGKTVLSDTTTQEPVGGLVEMPKAHAMVGYEAGRVHTDGNFGSFRIGVSLQWPCVPEYGALEDTYEFVMNYVNQKLVEELQKGGLEVKE